MDDQIKDPVCGMTVDPKTAEYSVDYEGRAYYFCSADCLEAFEDSPEEYAADEQAS
jgi:YHS domain-containing protein